MTREYDIEDLSGSCGDYECCGGPFYYVFLPSRGWVGGFCDYSRADRMARLCERWGVQ